MVSKKRNQTQDIGFDAIYSETLKTLNLTSAKINPVNHTVFGSSAVLNPHIVSKAEAKILPEVTSKVIANPANMHSYLPYVPPNPSGGTTSKTPVTKKTTVVTKPISKVNTVITKPVTKSTSVVTKPISKATLPKESGNGNNSGNNGKYVITTGIGSGFLSIGSNENATITGTTINYN